MQFSARHVAVENESKQSLILRSSAVVTYLCRRGAKKTRWMEMNAFRCLQSTRLVYGYTKKRRRFTQRSIKELSSAFLKNNGRCASHRRDHDLCRPRSTVILFRRRMPIVGTPPQRCGRCQPVNSRQVLFRHRCRCGIQASRSVHFIQRRMSVAPGLRQAERDTVLSGI